MDKLNDQNFFGRTGWICPVCGRGLSPFTAFCPCHDCSGAITYGTATELAPKININTEIMKVSPEQFVETYCHNCGSQRCEGIGTDWFEGCVHKGALKRGE